MDPLLSLETSIPLIKMDGSSRQKISKHIVELDNTIDQAGYNEHLYTVHLTTAEYTFFSSSYGTFTKNKNNTKSDFIAAKLN